MKYNHVNRNVGRVINPKDVFNAQRRVLVAIGLSQLKVGYACVKKIGYMQYTAMAESFKNNFFE